MLHVTAYTLHCVSWQLALIYRNSDYKDLDYYHDKSVFQWLLSLDSNYDQRILSSCKWTSNDVMATYRSYVKE